MDCYSSFGREAFLSPQMAGGQGLPTGKWDFRHVIQTNSHSILECVINYTVCIYDMKDEDEAWDSL